MDCSKKKLKIPLKTQLKDLRGFIRLIYLMGIRPGYRKEFWRTLYHCVRYNPAAIRYVVACVALYLHFGEFKDHIVASIERQMAGTAALPRPEPQLQLAPAAIAATPALALT